MISRVSLAGALAIAALTAQDSRPGRLEPTARIEGQVVDMRDEPVPLAEVWAVSPHEPDRILARTRCDGEGFFVLGRLAPRDGWALRATADGRIVGHGFARPGGDPERLVLHDAAAVTGVLRDREGRPVADTVVRAHFERTRSLPDMIVDARTDAAGRFTLSKVPLGNVRLTAVVPGQGRAVTLHHVQGDARVDLAPVAEPTTSLAIEVTGIPAPRARSVHVTLIALAAASGPRRTQEPLPPPWDQPSLDDDGRCRIEHLPDLEYVVRLQADACIFTPEELRAMPGTGPHLLRFAARAVEHPPPREPLVWPAVLRDPLGRPIAGARLLMSATRTSKAEAVSDEHGAIRFVGHFGIGATVVVESMDEAWVIEPVLQDGGPPPGMRFAPRQHCILQLERPSMLTAVPACMVSGTVRLADGRPAALTEVRLEDEQENRLPRWSPVGRIKTDRQGNYRMGRLLPIGNDVRVRVESRAGSATSEPFALAEPGTRWVAPDITLSPPATVEGIVRAPDGNPLPGARVWLRDWDFQVDRPKSGSLVEVHTDRLGRYRFRGVPPGGAWLQVAVTEAAPTEGAAPPFQVESGRTSRHELKAKHR